MSARGLESLIRKAWHVCVCDYDRTVISTYGANYVLFDLSTTPALREPLLPVEES